MRQTLSYLLLAVWGVVTVTVTSLLMVNHTVAMPSPVDIEGLRRSLQDRVDGTTVVHFIHERCSCTNSLLEHLFERGAGASVREHLVYIGTRQDRIERARQAGYTTVRIDEAELRERHGLVAAPVLVVLGAEAQLQYVGGYYRYPAAAIPLDVDIVATVLDIGTHDGLPVFGCAVDADLRRTVDPLGLQEW